MVLFLSGYEVYSTARSVETLTMACHSLGIFFLAASARGIAIQTGLIFIFFDLKTAWWVYFWYEACSLGGSCSY